MEWKKVNITNINTHIKSLKNLQILKKHGLSVHTFRSDEDIINLFNIILSRNEMAGINSIKSYFGNNKYILNIELHFEITRYLLIKYGNEPDNAFIYDYFCIFEKILAKMVRLHKKECEQAIKFIKCKNSNI